MKLHNILFVFVGLILFSSCQSSTVEYSDNENFKIGLSVDKLEEIDNLNKNIDTTCTKDGDIYIIENPYSRKDEAPDHVLFKYSEKNGKYIIDRVYTTEHISEGYAVIITIILIFTVFLLILVVSEYNG